jgi:hypothetical protein
MPNLPNPLLQMIEVTRSVRRRAARLMHDLRLSLRVRTALAAEHLFLKHQLALYQERYADSRRHQNARRLILVWLSYWFNWQPALTIVQPETFTRWRRQGWRLLWKMPSKRGRPPIPSELRALIRQMARENLTWGQRRIANELVLKLGLRVSRRTVRKYMPTCGDRASGHRMPSQRWRTFVRNHARVLIVRGMAADLLTRGVQALSTRIRRCLHGWWGRAVARGVPGSAPRHAVALVLLSDMGTVPAARSPGTVDVISKDDRSPPARKPPHHHHPYPTTRALLMATFDSCPAVGAGGWWNRAHASARNARPLSKKASQAVPLPRAA